MLTVPAPAKINLTLEVLAERGDGFHEIRSVMQAVSLCDKLHFRPSREVGLKSDMPGWVVQESLVAKAVDLVRETTGCGKWVEIDIEKHIPLLSGLGGDSSDAAAVLRGLNQLWGLGLSQSELVEMATRLGSDVAFFLYGGTVLVGGRGEMVTPLPPLPRSRVVLVLPSVARPPRKTAQLYANLKTSDYSDGQITQRLVAVLKAGRALEAARLFNVFDRIAPAQFAGLDKYREQMMSLGATDVHLAGSGPALFTLLEDKARAEELYHYFQQQGWEAYLAETVAEIDNI
ncbi:MAG: 4-(cytidine 5'-diphospho)-2-C-methyl-D-erythritol kinase [Dehalococcoidia bacterium]|nr:MAG: 4-(cytidine 5'-diphospho)-2-C-methyl-D-erythritol kinase [Dehalococcoidia bacterium]